MFIGQTALELILKNCLFIPEWPTYYSFVVTYYSGISC